MRHLFPAALILLAGCVNRGVTVTKDYGRTVEVLESGAISRGRLLSYRPPVTIENAQALNLATYRDLQEQFLSPIEQGPWRYVIEGITLDGAPEVDGEWTLLVALDTGARVKLENFGAWDEKSGTCFKDGYRRLVRALAEIRSRDASLDRYLNYWSRSRQAARKTVSGQPATVASEG